MQRLAFKKSTLAFNALSGENYFQIRRSLVLAYTQR